MNAIVAQAMALNDRIAQAQSAQEAAVRTARRVSMIEAWTPVFADLVATVSGRMESQAAIHAWPEGDSYILVANGQDWRMTVDESYPEYNIRFDHDEFAPARLTIDGVLGEIGVYWMPSGTYFLPLSAAAADGEIRWVAPRIRDTFGNCDSPNAPSGLTGDLVEAVASALRSAPEYQVLA